MGMAMGNAMQQGLQGQQTVGAAGPPPLPKKVSYYASIGNQQAGPFELSVIQDKLTAGAMTRETLVWTTGMAQWIPAGNVAELAQLFQDVPPPLPPKA
jgi:hypothetical protein